MAAPKLKTNDIIMELKPSTDAGRLLLSAFEKQVLLRQVRSIDLLYQSLALEGLIQLLDGKSRLGIEAFERSINLCPSDGVTWVNYSSVLVQKSLYVQAGVLINRAIDQSIYQVSELALEFGAFWCDMDMIKRVLNMAEKYGYEFTDSDNLLSRFNSISKLDECLVADIRNAASVVRKIAEDSGLPCRKSTIEDDGFGEVSFSCEIDVDDVDTLVNLNAKIIDDMVGLGYETGCCVAYFKSAESV